MKARSEDRAPYADVPSANTDDDTIRQALAILERRLGGAKDVLTSPQNAKDYLRLKTAALEHEVFMCVWLDAQNRVIDIEQMFRGTLTQASVYPREVVKSALAKNAASVMFAHNHPSGSPTPSNADRNLTRDLMAALSFVDVRVLDHFVIGASDVFSFAERGYL